MTEASSDESPLEGADDPQGGESSGSSEFVSGSQPRTTADGDDDAGELPRMLGERYRLEELLAKGGMGRVYAAIQLPLERRVAVKLLVIPPNGGGDFRRRFLLEASICARLTHPNIVVVHDYGETPGGELFMAMELLEGEPLNVLQRREGPLPPSRVIGIALQVLRALRAAHREGVAHRDLKPGNVFVEQHATDEGHDVDVVKVLDFGLVKVYEDGKPAVERDLTQGDMMLGSPRYMSPEQIMCEPVDARTDLYSLGVLLYSLLAGRPPFVGRGPVDILTQHLNRPPPRIATTLEEIGATPAWTVPPALEEIVLGCMEKDPRDRPQSADDLIGRLKRVQREIVGDGPPGVGMEGLLTSSSGLLVASQEMAAVVADAKAGPVLAPAPIAEPDAPDRGRWALIAALFVVVIVIAVVAALSLPVGGEPEPTRPETLAPAVTTVTVHVTSEPPGAEVTSGGVLLGATPITRSMPPTSEGSQRVFELTLDGYQTARVARVIEGEALTVAVTLQALVEEPPAPVTAEPTPPATPATSSVRSGRRRSAQDPSTSEEDPPTQTQQSPTQSPVTKIRLPEGRRGSIVVDDEPRPRVPIVD